MSFEFLQSFAYPLPIGLMLIAVGTVLFWYGRRGVATAFTGTALVGLYLLATPALADLLMASLEQGSKPANPAEHPQADAIVVLGGGILPPISPAHSPNVLDAADRIRTGARLYNARKAPLIVTTGARPFPSPGPSAAAAAAELLRALGVPGSAIIALGRASSTREDALSVRTEIKDRGHSG